MPAPFNESLGDAENDFLSALGGALYTLNPTETFSGSLTTGTDNVDWMAINVVENVPYTFALNGSGLSPLSDPQLTIVDANGALVAGDDDSGPGFNSLLTFTPATSGTFYVQVYGWAGNGDYTLTFDGPSITPTNGADALSGGAGNDTIHARGGHDIVYGQGGDDKLVAGSGNDTVYGGTGNDNINGGNGSDILYGDEGNDFIRGEKGNDFVYGGDGQYNLRGGNGNDVIDGGEGDDYIRGDGNNDTIDGGIGDDTLDGGAGKDQITGGAGNDVMLGGGGRDKLWGGAGSDEMYGGDGNDLIKGNSGDDIMEGGAGNDYLTGGSGADTFVFTTGSGSDQITDFEVGVDTIDLSDFNIDAENPIATYADVGANFVISFDSGEILTLQNVNEADLLLGDFIF